MKCNKIIKGWGIGRKVGNMGSATGRAGGGALPP